MKPGHTTTHEHRQALSAGALMAIGAFIGFLLISVFVFGIDQPNPGWGKWWRIKPLLLTPCIAALGGLFYYYMSYLGRTRLNKGVATIIGILGFIFSLWIGIVLGLNGTMWD